jgi:hypothetical protein
MDAVKRKEQTDARATRSKESGAGSMVTYRLCLVIQSCLLCFFGALDMPSTAQQVTTGKVQQANVILGVLEDIPGESSGESDIRAVRAVFEKNGDDWRPFPTKTKSCLDLQTLPSSYPREMTWTIAFDGRDLGRITSQTPAHFSYYSDIGIEYITSHGRVPTVGKKSADYAGFLFSPVYRPLVAVSQPNFADPQHWKPAQLSPTLVAAARQQFRSKFPKASNCRNPEENVLRPWKYRDEDIHETKAYSSNDGWSLIELNLTGYACDGPNDSTGFVGQWYAIDPSGAVRFLGTDMWLVDAGDYDNSGKSEVLFSIDGYNMGGYRLFYRDFTRSTEFLFYYH